MPGPDPAIDSGRMAFRPWIRPVGGLPQHSVRPMSQPTPPYVQPRPLPSRSDPLRRAIDEAWLADETEWVNRLKAMAQVGAEASAGIVATAADWVRGVRRLKDEQSMLDAFMHEYDLSSEEGVLLMCLAEALLRIPDDDTAEALIADKLADANWEAHLGHSDSLFVNASTWGLMLTGKIVKLSPDTRRNFSAALGRLVARSGEPVIRTAVRQAMKLMGHQFVMGRSIDEAMKRAGSREQRGFLHSFDMLGEAALTAADARRYLAAYHDAITRIGEATRERAGEPVMQRPGISIKLSALHPRYEYAKAHTTVEALVPVLRDLALAARRENIGLTVDAEEADRLDLSLDIFERVYRDRALSGWDGFGLAVQAFQKRALPVVEWLEWLVREVGRRIPVRLVKGAYWDTEIKRAQEQGLSGYPVYTRKVCTDVAYLAIARRLLGARDVFYPQFATHNAHTVAAVRAYAGDETGYEFQRLHGMGEALYRVVREQVAVPCRVYAPVGSHEDLLPYLVRRLLENGANTSFVNRVFDEAVSPEALAADPLAQLDELPCIPNPQIPMPVALYGGERLNSIGLNLADRSQTDRLAAMLAAVERPACARSRTALDSVPSGPEQAVLDPADHRRIVGQWVALPVERAGDVVAAAVEAQPAWSRQPVDQRAQLLERAAEQLEARRCEFMQLLIREAGKTIPDAVAEVREAVDFLRYYAAGARRAMSAPLVLPGPTGEHNELQLHGRGVWVCISPWNFPLAIFVGQVAAALVTGNTVIAKPAEQTNLVADAMTRLMHEVGVPRAVLQTVLGSGDLGAALCADARVAGVAFTGSDETARAINRTLAQRDGPIGVLIAETGGQNAMLVDSSALPEQVVKDVLQSAFGSAGQRCSALRVLMLQEEIADRVTRMLAGAMDELSIGDPGLLSTDVGPVIDAEALERLNAHADAISQSGRLLRRLSVPDACRHGTYFAPCAVEIDSIEQLQHEHFGAMLHIVRFRARELDAMVDHINATGYGLTLGVHSRIESTWRRVQSRARVGNCYVNRNMIGAVVGVQPFGGEGRSGTGPKAGGPHYLYRFMTERTLTINTAAVGGNARLLSQSG